MGIVVNWFRRHMKKKNKKEKDSQSKREINSIAKRWELLSGQNNWKGLLYPLDYGLRHYIIHYGEMAQAAYDTFNSQHASKYAGSSIYSRANLFSSVGLTCSNPLIKYYHVTKYLYATSSISVPDAFIFKPLSREAWTKESNWMGYVAVATDEGKVVLGRREILIAWRGTIEALEWVNDLDFSLLTAPEIFGLNNHTKVHQGWYSIYTSSDQRSPFTKKSAREQVLGEVQRLVDLYAGEEISITVTGHSLGAAVGTLNAVDIVRNGFNKTQRKSSLVTAILHASPRVGDDSFLDAVCQLDQLRILRIRNTFDIVPRYPLVGYTDVGQVLDIDTTQSNYLKYPGNPFTWHNLECYLHGMASTQGPGDGSKLVIKRDVSLVNKCRDALKDEYCVPIGWWCLKNKGMVQQNDGSWKLCDHQEGSFGLDY